MESMAEGSDPGENWPKSNKPPTVGVGVEMDAMLAVVLTSVMIARYWQR